MEFEPYSGLNSFLHKLDPRTKLLTTLAFIIMVVVTPLNQWQAFIFYFALIGGLVIMSQLPKVFILKRSLVIVPFVLLMGVFNLFKPGEAVLTWWMISVSNEGLLTFISLLIKAWLSILSLIVLTQTTGFNRLLKGLEGLRMPQVMVMLLSFMSRYVFVLVEEVLRMKVARDSRSFGGGWLWAVRTLGNMIGTIFVRSYERGERVYQAMTSRGYGGQIRLPSPLRVGMRDFYFAFSFVCLLMLPLFLW
jgi:cobalt/nickel transport system permease protein